MKYFFILALLVFSMVCDSGSQANFGETPGNLSTHQQTPANKMKADQQTVTLDERGISFILPKNWLSDGDPMESGSSWGNDWLGSDNMKLSLFLSEYKPEYRKDSIEDEMGRFYEEKKRAGSKDVRFLEIGGVKGVHHENEIAKQDGRYAFIKWDAQYSYKNNRRIISISLTSPAGTLATNRAALYAILNSFRFL